MWTNRRNAKWDIQLNTRQNKRIFVAFILQHDIEFDVVEDWSDNKMEKK